MKLAKRKKFEKYLIERLRESHCTMCGTIQSGNSGMITGSYKFDGPLISMFVEISVPVDHPYMNEILNQPKG